MTAPGLKKIRPYWHAYQTMAKQRWCDRELLELVSTEFRDRSIEYYRYALESGVTTINGKIARPDTIVRNGDRIENIVHRHEPAVTSIPVKVLVEDKDRQFIVIDKPGSIPVHATGRYHKNSLIEILKNEFGYDKIYPVNRLDRLTSGCMILGLTSGCARLLCDEFKEGTIKKEYIARCRGQFPRDEVVCNQPLITIDRQMGLNIVHPEGKPAETIFRRLFHDPKTNTSVLHCRPITGRSHQIRVHLQYLGYPIANDPVYSDVKIWGPSVGQGGLDLTPSNVRSPPVPPPGLVAHPSLTLTSGVPTPIQGSGPGNNNNALTPPIHHLAAVEVLNSVADDSPAIHSGQALLPRETGEDIGMSAPIPLSAEAVRIITALRNMKDKSEDWGRWKDNICIGKQPLVPKRISDVHASQKFTPALGVAPPRLSVIKDDEEQPYSNPTSPSETDPNYCPECYLPLHPDPKPSKLYIFLHALRYTTSLGSFETEMPWWAHETWAGEGMESDEDDPV